MILKYENAIPEISENAILHPIADLSIIIFRVSDKSPVQRGFFKKHGQFITCPKVSGRAV